MKPRWTPYDHFALSLEPDEHMRWIYDSSHPDYNSPIAKDLRERRAAAIRSAPKWMVESARFNNAMRRANNDQSSQDTPTH